MSVSRSCICCVNRCSGAWKSECNGTPHPLHCIQTEGLFFFLSAHLLDTADPLVSQMLKPSVNLNGFVDLSGFAGGKFLERSRARKPGQARFGTEPIEYYTAQDMYVGANLVINDHNFVLLDADNYVYNYMEGHADEVGCLVIQLICVNTVLVSHWSSCI